MILKRLKIHAFGGLADREITFENGLNVVEGPNEAGKSTIYNAIQRVLLTRSKLRKPELSRLMERHIPLGGDTASVELAFQIEGNEYLLTKKWGATPSSELQLPDGVRITDDDRICRELAQLLPASEGTFQAVLMSYQGGIGETLEDLGAEGIDALDRLGDLLRKAFLQADGVSVDEFRARVERAHTDILGRWDRARNQPEGGRGLDQRWKNGTGLIVEAYYSAVEKERAYQNAQTFESELDRLTRELEEKTALVRDKDGYVQANGKAYADSRERRELEAKKELLEQQLVQLKKVAWDWPVSVSKLGDAEESLREIGPRLEKLQREKETAQKYEEGRELRERLKRGTQRAEQLEQARSELQIAVKIGVEDIERIRKISKEIHQLESAVSAGKLLLEFTAKADADIEIQSDLDPASTVSLKAGGTRKTEGGSRIRLEHRDWRIEVTSGVGNVQDALDKLQEVRDSLSKSLQAVGAASVEEAGHLQREYQRKLDACEAAETSLDQELDGESLEELTKRIGQASSTAPHRALSEVVEELANAKRDERAHVETAKTLQSLIENYTTTYKTIDHLNLTLGEASVVLRERSTTLETLAPVPAGFANAKAFMDHFDRVNKELVTAREARARVDRDKAALEGRAPDQSADELKLDWDSAREAFESAQKKGGAIARVMEATEEIVRGFDAGTYKGLQAEIARTMGILTDSRYNQVAMDESLPSALLDKAGRKLPLEYLSAGTRDVLGLSLRLAMAGHFLEDSDGFMMMDDPLVDLDPFRQARAAELLCAFAENLQLIVFTCHPDHARVLGGTRVKLN